VQIGFKNVDNRGEPIIFFAPDAHAYQLVRSGSGTPVRVKRA